jgi:raffinose/stachyose/melibiose transport system permease protein
LLLPYNQVKAKAMVIFSGGVGLNRKLVDKIQDFSFVLPALLIFSFVILAPFVRGLNIAFTDWNGITSSYHYIGLRNLVQIFSDTQILTPFSNTIFFTVVTVCAVNVFGLMLAVALNKSFKSADIIKTLIFMPMVVSLVLTSYMWVYTFNDFGTRFFGIASPLSSTSTVMIGLCIMSIWKETGLAMVIYYAALKTVPQELLESAQMDGANAFTKFFKITVPFLAPAFTYCIPLWIGLGLKQFDYSFVATAGGPGISSMSMAMYIYEYEFPYYKAGYGQMVSIVYLLFVLIITYFVIAMLRKREIEI